MTNDISNLTKIQPEEVYEPVIDLAVFDESRLCESCGCVLPNFGPCFQPKTCEACHNNTWSISFPSDFVVVGFDSECADMDNPRGEIIRERFYIVAEDAKGNRRLWGGLYDTPEAAEAAYAFLAPAVSNWEATRPCYGSEAWTPEVDAAEVEAELAADDFDMFEPELQM